MAEGDALKRFTRDLTADARAGRLEPVRCREAEVERVIDILLRHGKNNPTLVGPAGVGKTAIAEGLAQRIAEGRVPLVLRNVRLLSLDHVGLLAGTTFRGQYEQRISALVDETTAARNVILFIDELHNLIGQGTALGAAMDAANMLKPALVRGDFRVIGATTNEEYERWILGDPALERRFQKVVIRELGADEALEILRARKERLERHHNVLIADEALQSSVTLTDSYVTDRMRPDKAIDALDEACAHMQAAAVYLPRAEELMRRRQHRRPGDVAGAHPRLGAQRRIAAHARRRAAHEWPGARVQAAARNAGPRRARRRRRRRSGEDLESRSGAISFEGTQHAVRRLDAEGRRAQPAATRYQRFYLEGVDQECGYKS